MMAPSNSVPWSVLIVTGEKLFHRMVSQMLVAMKREIPDPNPYPFYNNSSSISTMKPAMNNWKMIKADRISPSSDGGPYIPERR